MVVRSSGILDMDVRGDKPNSRGTSRLCRLIDSSEHTDFDNVLLRIGGLVAKMVDSAPEKPYASTLGPFRDEADSKSPDGQYSSKGGGSIFPCWIFIPIQCLSSLRSWGEVVLVLIRGKELYLMLWLGVMSVVP